MKKVLHYPRLDTVMNVEEVIEQSKEPLSKNEIDRRLTKKIMRPTLNVILDYLEKNRRISIGNQGIVWVNEGERQDSLSRGIEKEKMIEFLKPKIVSFLKRNDVIRAGVYGSFARGEQKKDSDIDILVQFKGRKTLFDLVKTERELGQKLNRKVDLLTYNSINPLLKQKILKEEIKLI